MTERLEARLISGWYKAQIAGDSLIFFCWFLWLFSEMCHLFYRHEKLFTTDMQYSLLKNKHAFIYHLD